MKDDDATQEADRIIERLGGTVKAALFFEVTKGAISQWRHTGVPKSHLRFIKIARPDLFIVKVDGSQGDGVPSIRSDP